MGPRALIVAALVGLTALAVAGCGGGGEESTTTAARRPEPTALTKSELIRQGDSVCAEVNAAVGSLASAETQVAGTATQVADLYSGMVENLKGLGRPREAAGYSEFIGTAEELAEAEDDAKLAAERGDSAGLESAESRADGALAAFQSQAAEYGFHECSEGPSELPSGGAGGGSTPGAPNEAGGGTEAEEAAPEEEVAPEEFEEVAPEAGGVEETAPEGGGEPAGGGASPGGGGGETEGSSGGIGAG